MISVGILTISDKGARGERKDESGKAIEKCLVGIGAAVKIYDIVPDEKDMISNRLKEWSDESKLDLIFTTGGTGLSPRDFTPEST